MSLLPVLSDITGHMSITAGHKSFLLHLNVYSLYAPVTEKVL